MFPVYDFLAQDIREIILWFWRGLALPAAIALYLGFPQLLENFRDWRRYNEPLGAKTPLLCCICLFAVVVLWRAQLF